MAGPLFVTGPRGVQVKIRLTPKAGRNAVTGRAVDADGAPLLKAAVTAVPERGAANAALIAACNPKATTELLDALKARDAEIERLRGALNLAVDHIDMSALRISHCKDAAAIDQARATGGEKANG